MQAIARVNRVYKDKEGGLVVDYLGIAASLKQALATYTESGGKGKPTFDQSEAVALMREKLEVVSQILHGYAYDEYFEADTRRKMMMLVEAQDFFTSRDIRFNHAPPCHTAFQLAANSPLLSFFFVQHQSQRFSFDVPLP